jgi:hypothetical protein
MERHFEKKSGSSGQMMILLVVIMSAVALAAMTLSSFLIVAQLKQVTDARLSGSALFAADEGIECVLFHEFNYDVYNATANNGLGSGCPTYSDTLDACSGSWSGQKNIVGAGKYRFRCDNTKTTPTERYFISVASDPSDITTRALQIKLVKRL